MRTACASPWTSTSRHDARCRCVRCALHTRTCRGRTVRCAAAQPAWSSLWFGSAGGRRHRARAGRRLRARDRPVRGTGKSEGRFMDEDTTTTTSSTGSPATLVGRHVGMTDLRLRREQWRAAARATGAEAIFPYDACSAYGACSASGILPGRRVHTMPYCWTCQIIHESRGVRGSCRPSGRRTAAAMATRTTPDVRQPLQHPDAEGSAPG